MLSCPRWEHHASCYRDLSVPFSTKCGASNITIPMLVRANLTRVIQSRRVQCCLLLSPLPSSSLTIKSSSIYFRLKMILSSLFQFHSHRSTPSSTPSVLRDVKTSLTRLPGLTHAPSSPYSTDHSRWDTHWSFHLYKPQELYIVEILNHYSQISYLDFQMPTAIC